MPTAFSIPSLTFDRRPDDDQLVWLLGDADHPGTIVVADTPSQLSARPGLVPLKFAASWILFTGVVISALPWIVRHFGLHFDDGWAWGMIGLIWLGVVPALQFLLIACNRHFAAQGDYFRVHKREQRLELCRVGRSFLRDEILEITDLSRWQKHFGASWEWTRQIGVLVNESDGGVAHFPLVRETEWRLWSRNVADLVGAAFRVPVRRVVVDYRESQELCDC